MTKVDRINRRELLVGEVKLHSAEPTVSEPEIKKDLVIEELPKVENVVKKQVPVTSRQRVDTSIEHETQVKLGAPKQKKEKIIYHSAKRKNRAIVRQKLTITLQPKFLKMLDELSSQDPEVTFMNELMEKIFTEYAKKKGYDLKAAQEWCRQYTIANI